MRIYNKDYAPTDAMSVQQTKEKLIVFGCFILELAMWVMFFGVYAETVGLMQHSYLSDLPIIGTAFELIDPDANISHILSALLATFSVGTPLVIWAEIYRQNIFETLQEWLSFPTNKVYASIAIFILLIVIALEATCMFTLLARETSSVGFVQEQQSSDIMEFLAQNKGVAIAVSGVVAIINILLALFTTRAMRNLNSDKENSHA